MHSHLPSLQRVVGQDYALEAVSDIVRLSRTHLQAQDSTLGNLLFVGPTGKLPRIWIRMVLDSQSDS